MNTNCILEVCIDADDISHLTDNIHAAIKGGATRIELCRDLSEDGLTPSQYAVNVAREAIGEDAELLIMCRPRGGVFDYSKDELDVIKQDIRMAASSKADGVVLGVLNSSQQINTHAMDELCELAHQLALSVTFHRAFDCIDDWQSALDYLINSGVKRLLTSGTPWHANQGAAEGITRLLQIMNVAKGRIECVIGGGINANSSIAVWSACHRSGTKISLHAFSGVLSNNRVDAFKVQSLIRSITDNSAANNLA